MPSPFSQFCLLAPLLLQLLTPYCLLILPDRSSSPQLPSFVVLHYLRACCPTPCIDVIPGATISPWLQIAAHMSSCFLSSPRSHILPLGPCRAFVNQCFVLFLGEPAAGLGLSPVRLNQLFPYVCGVYYLRCWARGIFAMESGCLSVPMKR